MDSLQFQISSTNADSKSNNEYVYYIPSNSILGDTQEHIYLSIQSAIIPNSFYNINKYNNTLIYSMDSNNIKQSFLFSFVSLHFQYRVFSPSPDLSLSICLY